ncbi:MAG: hypothetical protein U1F51_06510 [Burkholderiales bacterium]
MGDPPDRREIAQRVVADVRPQRGCHHEVRVSGEEQRVAVGCGPGDRFGADRTAGTRSILDDDRAAQVLGQRFGDDPRDLVGGASRFLGGDQPDRAMGVGRVLVATRRRSEHREQQHRANRATRAAPGNRT